MAIKHPMTIRNRNISIRELTIEDVDCWMTRLMSNQGADPVSGLLFADPYLLEDLSLVTGLTKADLLAFTPTEIRRLQHGCQQRNPRFFKAKARMNKLHRHFFA